MNHFYFFLIKWQLQLSTKKKISFVFRSCLTLKKEEEEKKLYVHDLEVHNELPGLLSNCCTYARKSWVVFFVVGFFFRYFKSEYKKTKKKGRKTNSGIVRDQHPPPTHNHHPHNHPHHQYPPTTTNTPPA